MKRTPKAKRPMPSRAGSSAKKQQSILSFFPTSTQRNNRSPVAPRQPVTSHSATTPSTATSLEKRRSPPAAFSAPPAPRPAAGSPDAGLRRALFADDDDDAPLIRPVKRRRVLRLDDFSDDEAGADTPRDRGVGAGGRVQGLAPRAASAVRHAPVGGRTVGSEPRVSTTRHFPPPPKKVMEKDGSGVDCIGDEMRDGGDGDQGAKEGNMYNFKSLQCPTRGDSEAGAKAPSPSQLPSKTRNMVREKLGALDGNYRGVGNEEGGWCQRHLWSTDIRDAKKRRPNDPNYDKTTLYVPPGLLAVSSRGTKGGGLSPFQKQFWSIKMVNYDVIIFFKKGKFYEMYDVDADVGHQQLGLNFTKGGRVDMRCCGVPEQAFDKHCARLIDLGYKVGRVEQTETANAAEKRKNGRGSNKSAVCERSLVRILTKATVNDDGLLRDHRARYVLAITESGGGPKFSDSDQSTSVEDGSVGSENTASKTIGVCYVDVASGGINAGEYNDDFRLAKTERLMTFLRPQEVITDLSAASERLANIVGWASNKSDAEIVDTGRKKGFSNMTESWLRTYLETDSSSPQKTREYERVRLHFDKYPLSCKAFGAMASHLKSLIIDKETLSLGNYNLFPEAEQPDEGNSTEANGSSSLPCASRLRMDAPTLQNLEVLASSIDESERGALLCFVDRAFTPAGRRLVRKWIAEPLVAAADIEDRLQAIEDIHKLEDEDGGRKLHDILKQLRMKKDLERALPKLHQQATVNNSAVMFDDTNKRRVKDFIVVLRSLEDSLKALDSFREAMESCSPKSKRLKWLYSLGNGVPSEAAEKLQYFLGDAFDMESAENSGEILPKEGAVPAYDSCRLALDDVEQALAEELEKWQKRLDDRSIKFYHRGKEPYQMEVKLDTLCGGTPREFEVVSEGKTVKRFYTNRVKSLVRDQVEASEAYEEASSSVARDMMVQFDSNFNTWSAVSVACAEIDALIGLASASRDEGSGPMCRPIILPNGHPEPVLKAEGLRHPILAARSTSFVSNDVTLGGGDPEIMILTGPNAGGKSTLARQVALGVILAQLGCFVPAKSFCIRPFEDIFVRMGASDDLARGRSTFMVEMEEVANILNNANSRSLIIADEVGRGTSTHDGYAVAYASLDHISKVNKSLTVFSTHYSHLGGDIVALGKNEGRVQAALFEMGAVIDEVSKKITFLYKLQPGSSGDSRGIYCARVAGIPESIAEYAEKASERFDDTLALRLAAMKFLSVSKGLSMADERAVLALQQK